MEEESDTTNNPPAKSKNGKKWWLKHKEEIMVWTSILTLAVSIVQVGLMFYLRS